MLIDRGMLYFLSIISLFNIYSATQISTTVNRSLVKVGLCHRKDAPKPSVVVKGLCLRLQVFIVQGPLCAVKPIKCRCLEKLVFYIGWYANSRQIMYIFNQNIIEGGGNRGKPTKPYIFCVNGLNDYSCKIRTS